MVTKQYPDDATKFRTDMFAKEDYMEHAAEFWAYVRLVSQQAGYQPRGNEVVKVYEPNDLQNAVESTGINGEPLFGDFSTDGLTNLGENILSTSQSSPVEYF